MLRRLHGLSDLLQVFLDVVENLHRRLRNSGPRAEDTADAALVQKLIVLERAFSVKDNSTHFKDKNTALV